MGTPCRENRRLRPLLHLFYFVAITSENNVKDHFGFIRGECKWLRHICASCWTRLRKQEPHRENSSDCPINALAAKGSPAPSKKLEYFSPHSPHNTEAGGVPDVDLGCGSSASARDFLSQDFSPTSRSKSRLLFSCPSFSTQDNGFLEISPSRPSVLIMQHLLPPVVSLTLIALSFLLDSLIIPGFLFPFLPVWIFQGGLLCSNTMRTVSFVTFWNFVDHLVTLTRLFLCLTLVPIAVRWLISAVKFPSVAWQDLSLTQLFMTVLLLLLSTRWPSVTLTNEEWSSIWADSVVPQLMMVFLLVTFLESFWNWTIPLLMPLSRRLLHSVGVTCYTSAIYGECTANSPLIPTIIIYLVIRGTFSFTLTQF